MPSVITDQPAGVAGGGALRLFVGPGAVSQAPHVALLESGLPFDLVRLPRYSESSDAANRLPWVSPFGEPPLLELNDGSTLREAPAIMEFVADLVPAVRLVPPCGTFERAQLAEWLHFLAAGIYRAESRGATEGGQGVLRARLAWIDLQLAPRPYLLGSRYSIADIYLWTLWNWTRAFTDGATEFTNIERWFQNISVRGPVLAALRAGP